MTKDYRITLEDDAGRTCSLSINGDSIDEAIKAGCPLDIAMEQAENNAAENAIARGDIGATCFLVSTTFTNDNPQEPTP